MVPIRALVAYTFFFMNSATVGPRKRSVLCMFLAIMLVITFATKILVNWLLLLGNLYLRDTYFTFQYGETLYYFNSASILVNMLASIAGFGFFFAVCHQKFSLPKPRWACDLTVAIMSLMDVFSNKMSFCLFKIYIRGHELPLFWLFPAISYLIIRYKSKGKQVPVLPVIHRPPSAVWSRPHPQMTTQPMYNGEPIVFVNPFTGPNQPVQMVMVPANCQPHQMTMEAAWGHHQMQMHQQASQQQAPIYLPTLASIQLADEKH